MLIFIVSLNSGHLQELCVKAHNHVIDAITYLFLPVHEQEERDK